MKYRHAYHAGNFADVHKHVALLALFRALQRKDKGFLFVDTHAGRGRYELARGDAQHSGESEAGVVRVLAALRRHAAESVAPELSDYAAAVESWRSAVHARDDYPGSAVLASHVLRAQDRCVAIEIQPTEFEALRKAMGRDSRFRVEHGDGYERLRACLPPPERRGITLLDPPYEDGRADRQATAAAVADALTRFETGVIAVWYPIKDARDSDRWLRDLARSTARSIVAVEIWLHPTDSRAGLNGSGLAVVNAPFQFADRCEKWQPQLLAALDTGPGAGQRAFAP